MKKFIATLMAVAMMFSMAACGTGSSRYGCNTRCRLCPSGRGAG